MLGSMPVWAIVAAHTAHTWGFYTLLTETPTYLSSIQHFSLTAVSSSKLNGPPSRNIEFIIFRTAFSLPSPIS
jgi:hypothetical protein